MYPFTQVFEIFITYTRDDPTGMTNHPGLCIGHRAKSRINAFGSSDNSHLGQTDRGLKQKLSADQDDCHLKEEYLLKKELKNQTSIKENDNFQRCQRPYQRLSAVILQERQSLHLV